MKGSSQLYFPHALPLKKGLQTSIRYRRLVWTWWRRGISPCILRIEHLSSSRWQVTFLIKDIFFPEWSMGDICILHCS